MIEDKNRKRREKQKKNKSSSLTYGIGCCNMKGWNSSRNLVIIIVEITKETQ